MALKQREKLVDLKFNEVVHETDKAWLIEFDPAEEPTWLPKSLVEMDEDAKTVTVPERFAIDKGIEKHAE